MTDNELAKRMAELGDAFKEMCQARDCYGCEMEVFAKEGVCCHAWIWKRLRAETCGKQDWCHAAQKEAAAAAPNESPEAKEGTRLPKWCRVGQWVMTGDGKILKIDCITGDLVSVRSPNGLAYCTSTPDLTFKPVRFREYSFKEAKGLLGKVMELDYENGCKRAMLIDCIGDNDGRVSVNGYKQESLMKRIPVTIDGVPFGVPEVDEELLKGGEE